MITWAPFCTTGYICNTSPRPLQSSNNSIVHDYVPKIENSPSCSRLFRHRYYVTFFRATRETRASSALRQASFVAATNMSENGKMDIDKPFDRASYVFHFLSLSLYMSDTTQGSLSRPVHRYPSHQKISQVDF